MALDQSALLTLLDALRSSENGDLVRSLAEHHDEWNVQDDRRYLSEASMAELYPTTPAGELPASLTPISTRTAL